DLNSALPMGDAVEALFDLAVRLERGTQRRAIREDLARCLELLQDRKQVIPLQRIQPRIVELVQINAVGPQTAQALLTGASDKGGRPVLGTFSLPGLRSRMVIEVVAELGGDHDLVAAVSESIGQE